MAKILRYRTLGIYWSLALLPQIEALTAQRIAQSSPKIHKLLQLIEERNVDVLVATEGQKILEIKKEIADITYMPQLQADAGASYAGGSLYGSSGNRNSQIEAGASLSINWLLFDGALLYKNEKFTLEQALSEAKKQSIIWALRDRTIRLYFDAVALRKQHAFFTKVYIKHMKLEGKVKDARKYEIANNDDVKAATSLGIYLTEKLLKIYTDLQRTKLEIENIIGKQIEDTYFDVLPDNLDLKEADFDRVISKLESHPSLRQASLETDLSRLSYKSQKNIPSLTFSTGLRYDDQRDDTGVLEPFAGVGLRMTLFDWGRGTYLDQASATERSISAIKNRLLIQDLRFRIEAMKRSFKIYMPNSVRSNLVASDRELEQRLGKAVNEVAWGIQSWQTAANQKFIELETRFLSSLGIAIERGKSLYSLALLEELLDSPKP